jgi:hypothetical protein
MAGPFFAKHCAHSPYSEATRMVFRKVSSRARRSRNQLKLTSFLQIKNYEYLYLVIGVQ